MRGRSNQGHCKQHLDLMLDGTRLDANFTRPCKSITIGQIDRKMAVALALPPQILAKRLSSQIKLEEPFNSPNNSAAETPAV